MNEPSSEGQAEITPPPLVNSDFLKIIKAWNPSVGSHIDTLMARYPALLRFGWSRAEIEMALAMGYNLRNHVVLPSGRQMDWKYGRNAEALYDWVRHYYRSYKAEKLGMSFEDFIALWRSFTNVHLRPTQDRESRMTLAIEQVMAYYMRARHYGLDDYEIRYAFFYRLDSADSYLSLRRRFDKQFVQKLLFASRKEPWRLQVKYVIEAQQRGASHEEILASVRGHSTHELALTRRRTQRGDYEE